jgi:hypothetical protein
MHTLVELHGQPGWVAALTPFSVDGMIVAASTTLLADSRSGSRGGFLPWALLVVGSMASLAANVAVAEPTATGRAIAAWPSFALIAAYEMLMRQVRHNAAIVARSSQGAGLRQDQGPASSRHTQTSGDMSARHSAVGTDLQREAWQWAQANGTIGGSLPSGWAIGRQFGRRERWGRLVKQDGARGRLEQAPPTSS